MGISSALTFLSFNGKIKELGKISFQIEILFLEFVLLFKLKLKLTRPTLEITTIDRLKFGAGSLEQQDGRIQEIPKEI